MGQVSGSRSRAPRSASRRQSGSVLKKVIPVATACTQEADLVLWDVAFVREGGRETLKIEVDRLGGVDAGEISKLADRLSKALDLADAVPGDQRYVLEVASPGAERKLTHPDHFRICVGRPARITFTDGRPAVEGTISATDEDCITLQLDGEAGTVRVGYEEISKARLNVPGV